MLQLYSSCSSSSRVGWVGWWGCGRWGGSCQTTEAGYCRRSSCCSSDPRVAQNICWQNGAEVLLQNKVYKAISCCKGMDWCPCMVLRTVLDIRKLTKVEYSIAHVRGRQTCTWLSVLHFSYVHRMFGIISRRTSFFVFWVRMGLERRRLLTVWPGLYPRPMVTVSRHYEELVSL